MWLSARLMVAVIALLALGVSSAAASASLTPQGIITIIPGATFVVALPGGGFVAGGPSGLQNYDANNQPVGSVYGASQLSGNTITNGLLDGGNLIVFGYPQSGGGQGFDEVFDPTTGKFITAHNVANPVELGGAAVIGSNIFIPDFSNITSWASSNGGMTWSNTGTLGGEDGNANGLAQNGTYIFLADGSGTVRYDYPSGTTHTFMSIPGSNLLVGGTTIAAGNMVFNDKQNVFQCAPDGTACLKINSTVLAGLGYPGTLTNGCVLVPSTNGSGYLFGPAGNNCGISTGGNPPGSITPGGGTTPPPGGGCNPTLVATKSADRNAVGSNRRFYWIISVENPGPCDWGQVHIADNLQLTLDGSRSGVYDNVFPFTRDQGLSASATYGDGFGHLPGLPAGKTWRFVFPWTAFGPGGNMTNVAAVTALDLNGHTTTYSLTGTVPVTTVPEQKGDPKVTATSIAGSVKPTAPPPTT